VKEKEIDGENNRLVLREVRFTNPRVRTIVSKMDLIIDSCIVNDDTLCDELKQAISHYREGKEILSIKAEFSKEELKAKKKK
jgi:hypothetical protein